MMAKFEVGRAITFDFNLKEMSDIAWSDISSRTQDGVFCLGHLPLN